MNLKPGAGGRAMVVNRKLLMMLAGRGDMGSDGEADFCAVISVNRDTDQVVRDLRALTGVEPAKDMPSDMKRFSVWAYIDGPKGREYLHDVNSRKAMKAFSDGKLTMLMAGEEQTMTIIMQMRPDAPE